MRSSSLFVRAVLPALLVLASCGGGADPVTPPTPKLASVYRGVFASGTERGLITLNSGTAAGAMAAANTIAGGTVASNMSMAGASGSVTIGSAAPVSVSGTFTEATGVFALSGSGITVQGTATSAGLTGTVTGTGITGTGVLAGAPAASTSSSFTRYCGVYLGDDSGMGDILVSGSIAVATITGMGGGFAMTGTASGNTVTLSATGIEPSQNKPNTVTANLTLDGSGGLSGTGSSTLFPTQRVTLKASTSGCDAVAPTGPFPTFVGVVGNNGLTGVITLNATASATGTLVWNSGTPIALSGTYDVATGRFAMTAPSVVLNATATGALLTGTVTGAVTGGAGILAMGSTSASPVTRYCGTTTGGFAGKMVVMTNGSLLQGLWINNSGSLALTGAGGNGWLYIVSGRTIYMGATGTAASYTGTYAHDNGASGPFTLTAGC